MGETLSGTRAIGRLELVDWCGLAWSWWIGRLAEPIPECDIEGVGRMIWDDWRGLWPGVGGLVGGLAVWSWLNRNVFNSDTRAFIWYHVTK